MSPDEFESLCLYRAEAKLRPCIRLGAATPASARIVGAKSVLLINQSLADPASTPPE